MKLIPGCCLIFLLLSVLIPKETEAAIDPLVLSKLAQLAVSQGLKLAKMLYYAKCKTANVPPGTTCPKTVYGIGMKPKQATSTAKIYASMFGKSSQCKQYVNIAGCKTYKFTEQLEM